MGVIVVFLFRLLVVDGMVVGCVIAFDWSSCVWNLWWLVDVVLVVWLLVWRVRCT